MRKAWLSLFLLLISPLVSIPLNAQDCSELYERPELSGEEFTRETDNFIIHYTDDGPDAATEEHIDYIQETLVYSLELQVNYFGWPLPLADCGEGGDQRFDIYIYDSLSEDITGMFVPEGNVSQADGGMSDYAVYGYLVMDNDFEEDDALYSTLPAVTAHELFHAIQHAFDASESSIWYYEATAVWMANATYPELEDLASFGVVQGSPELCLGFYTEEEEFAYRLYGEWVYFETLVGEAGGDPTIVLDLWRNIALYEGLDALYVTLDEYGLSPVDVSLSYAVRNLLLDYIAGQAMANAEDYVRTESDEITGPGEYMPDGEGVQELGVNYVPISELGMYSFALDNETLSMAVVGVNATDLTADVYVPANGESVDTSVYDYAYVLVMNPTLHTSADECVFTPWVLTVEEGDPDNWAGSLETVFDASNF